MTVLACDMGGRRIKLGVVRDGAVLAMRVLAAQAEQPLRERLPQVAESLRQLCDRADVSLSSCAGIGLGFPSIIDPTTARILDDFGKFGDASATDLRAWARNTFGLPLALDNDARMALLGEWHYGAGRGGDNLVMMSLGTGIGTAVVIEGCLLRGAHGQAGILGGHLAVQQDGQVCVCGNRGCAEAEASTWALDQLARQQPDFARSPFAHADALDFASVFHHAANGDACAQALREHSLRVWSVAAVNLIHAYDPERLILGGGVMGSADVILPAIRDYVERHAHTPWGKVSVVATKLGEQAALLACEPLVQEWCGKETQ